MNQEEFQYYIDELLLWNEKMNLICKNDYPILWERHFENSIQLHKFINKNDTILDIGSGAGFPGLVLAHLGYNVTLCEKSKKKSLFLKHMSKKIPVNLINDDIYNIPSDQHFTVITARAFAPLYKILQINLSCDRYVLLKGKNYMNEIENAKQHFDFTYQVHKYKEGVILMIEKLV